MVAARIREMMQIDSERAQYVTDKSSGRLRSVQYRDIVILLRSITGWADTFLKVLSEAGIPAHTTSQTGYFAAIEIQTVLSMLSILDNPLQDIPAAAVLASPIGGMNGEELARIRTASKEHFYFLALEEYAQYGEGALRQKAALFLELYHRLRRLTSYTPIHKLIRIVLEETGYASYIQAMPAGSKRLANMDMLIEKAIAYEKTSYKGLFHFVRYIEKLKKYEIDFGEADITSENENVVRIMSIHKSKGLEFPVVFVSGMGKQFNRQDIRSRMILHPEYGIGLDFIDTEKRTRKPGFIKKILGNEIGIENQGEELRVLYVALTRAKEKLVMTAYVKEEMKLPAHTNEETDSRPMDFFSRYQASSYLDWVYPCVGESLYLVKDLVLQEAVEAAAEKLDEMQVKRLYREADKKRYEALDEKLSWNYPFASDTDLKTKISVSELKRRQTMVLEEGTPAHEEWFPQERESLVPAFLRTQAEQENYGAMRGSAVHKVMEEVDFVQSANSSNKTADIRKQIEHMFAEGRITKEMKELVRPGMLARFLRHPIALRMAKAQEQGVLYKEQPFVMGIEASRVYEGASDELVLIQGIVDVCWEEEGALVILDYKTDAVTKAQQLTKRYQVQLDLYGEALQKATGKKIKEKLIYSFSLHKEIAV